MTTGRQLTNLIMCNLSQTHLFGVVQRICLILEKRKDKFVDFYFIEQDYIIRRLQLENDQITEDERLIKQYREDTEKKRDQIEELKTT